MRARGLQRGFGGIGTGHGVEPGDKMARIERQQHGIGAETVQVAIDVGQFLEILAVLTLVDGHMDVATQAGDADRSRQMHRRGRSQDRQPHRPCRQSRRRGREIASQQRIEPPGAEKIQPQAGQRHQLHPVGRTAPLGLPDAGGKVTGLGKPCQRRFRHNILKLKRCIIRSRVRSVNVMAGYPG